MAHCPRLDIAQLVADHHKAVYRYAFRLTGSIPDAEDLTQQVFLAARGTLGQLRNPERAQSWLFAILRNAYSKHRKMDRPWLASELHLNLDDIPEDEGASEIDQERLQQTLDAMPTKSRMVLLMFYYEGMSYREIGEALGVPIGTVMSRLARAKRHLRLQLLEKERSEEGTAVKAESPLATHSETKGGTICAK